MDIRIRPTTSYLRSVRLSRVRFGEKGSVPIDQTPAQSFNLDPATGRPMSDIQRLTKLQDNYALQTQFAQLKEFKTQFLPDDVSNEDALKFMCPRYSQLPSELLEYRDNLLRDHLSKEQAKQQKEVLAARQKEDEEYVNAFRDSLKSKDL